MDAVSVFRVFCLERVTHTHKNNQTGRVREDASCRGCGGLLISGYRSHFLSDTEEVTLVLHSTPLTLSSNSIPSPIIRGCFGAVKSSRLSLNPTGTRELSHSKSSVRGQSRVECDRGNGVGLDSIQSDLIQCVKSLLVSL